MLPEPPERLADGEVTLRFVRMVVPGEPSRERQDTGEEPTASCRAPSQQHTGEEPIASYGAPVRGMEFGGSETMSNAKRDRPTRESKAVWEFKQ